MGTASSVPAAAPTIANTATIDDASTRVHILDRGASELKIAREVAVFRSATSQTSPFHMGTQCSSTNSSETIGESRSTAMCMSPHAGSPPWSSFSRPSRIIAWRPPHSPFGLLEELFWDRPWVLLLCCVLLNQTSRRQVDPVLTRLLERYPDAQALSVASPADLEGILRPLGLHRQRSRTIVAFSTAFAHGGWSKPTELPGVGRYAADAHAIFCEGRYHETVPTDHALIWYRTWLLGLDDAEPERSCITPGRKEGMHVRASNVWP